MRQALRAFAVLLAAGAVAGGSSIALAGNGRGHGNRGGTAATTVFHMTAADGPPEGIAGRNGSRTFFVSRTGTGAIFRGTLGSTQLQPFIGGTTSTGSPLATGLKVRGRRLYVAGASTGEVRVYNLRNPAAPPAVFQTGGGFVNDLDVTGDGDVYATDSFKPAIYKITAAQVRAGAGTPAAISTAPEIPNIAGQFNLNGIITRDDGRELIVVQSETGQLFRIRFTPTGRTIREIAVAGGPLTGGDGLLRDRGRLLVVRGSTTANSTGEVDVVKLRRDRTRGTVVARVGDSTFHGPSTIARVRDRLLVVNANFAAAQNADDNSFTVSGLSRKAVRRSGR